MLFSQRKGLKPANKIVQKDDMDNELRYGLWNAFKICICDRIEYQIGSAHLEDSNLGLLFKKYWHLFYKRPIDNLSSYFDEAYQVVRKDYLDCSWNEVYDFIEFTAQNAPDIYIEDFCSFCNSVLESENSAYRFINSQLVEITSDEEIKSIEEAVKNAAKFGGVRTHLETALNLLSDRKNPDYRNSIKESISAVESIAKQIVGKNKATLGEALKIFETKGHLHPAFKQSLSSLYGYTSDADGIRHSLLDETSLSFVDAKYMLVSCTAFINYIIGKIAEIGIKI